MRRNYNTIFLAFLICASAFEIPDKLYGINLGGWLLLEKFITPSLYTGTIGDEYDYALQAKLDPTMVDKLINHWDTFFTEEDVRNMSDAGLGYVRLPVPFWCVMTQEELDSYNEPYIIGQWPYIERMLGWLKKYKIKAIVDLHAAPGSQNGWEHSGRRGEVLWGTGDTINRTLDYIERIAIKLAELDQQDEISGAVFGLELINEAYPIKVHGGLLTVKEYYTRAYDIVRKHLPAEKYVVVIEEAFSAALGGWIGFMPPPQYQNVILDIHVYHCFDEGLRMAPYDAHITQACVLNRKLNFSNQTLPTICGEWSVAWKNESGIAHLEPMPNDVERNFMKQLALAEMQTYSTAPSFGWMFWTWKTEHAPMWDYSLGMRGGWIPTKVPTPEIDAACRPYTSETSFPTDPTPTVPQSTTDATTTASPTTSATTGTATTVATISTPTSTSGPVTTTVTDTPATTSQVPSTTTGAAGTTGQSHSTTGASETLTQTKGNNADDDSGSSNMRVTWTIVSGLMVSLYILL